MKSITLLLSLSFAAQLFMLTARCENPKKTINKPPKRVVAEIDACVNQLGDENFRVRRKATRRLVEIGTFTKPKDGNPEIPYEAYVVERMKKLFKHKDPEVAQRARDITEKLHPTPKIDLSKHVKLPHFVDQQNDTLEIIAEMYGSKAIWIKAANPGLKTDGDLRKRKEISVPVENEGGIAEEIVEEIEIEEE
jgi:hypothetical protein